MNNAKVGLIFIAGAGHSGSTLLDMILSAHSNIFGTGELYHLGSNENESRCTCGKSYQDCRVWSKILNMTNGFEFDINRNFIDLFVGKAIYYQNDKSSHRKIDANDYCNKRRSVYNRLSEIAGKEIIIDSSKDINQVELLFNSGGMDISAIHLVRDGRGVVWSYMKKNCPFFKALRHWVFTNIKIEIVKIRHREKFINIRYSDLAKNTEYVIKEVLSKLELEYEPSMMNFRAVEQHQLSGNRMRFSRNESEINEDLSWKNSMPWRYKIIFVLLAGWLNAYYKFFIK